MVRFLVLYDTPGDPVAFERHDREVHIPLASGLLGCGCPDAATTSTTMRVPVSGVALVA